MAPQKSRQVKITPWDVNRVGIKKATVNNLNLAISLNDGFRHSYALAKGDPSATNLRKLYCNMTVLGFEGLQLYELEELVSMARPLTVIEKARIRARRDKHRRLLWGK